MSALDSMTIVGWEHSRAEQLHDFTVEDHGSIFLVRPLSDSAKEWINENIGYDAHFLGTALVVEHRYITNIIEGMAKAGLEIR